jgi:glyoxylase I family protein
MHRVAFSVDNIGEALEVAATHGCHPLRGMATYADLYNPPTYAAAATLS